MNRTKPKPPSLQQRMSQGYSNTLRSLPLSVKAEMGNEIIKRMSLIDKLYDDWKTKKKSYEDFVKNGALNDKKNKLKGLCMKKDVLYAEQKYIVVKGTTMKDSTGLYKIRADDLSREIHGVLSIISIIENV